MSSTTPLRVASFFGWSNSGKTTLVALIIEECARRGIRCGAAKCSRHGGDFEAEGKDSARFRAAGAAPVAYIGTGATRTTALFMPTPPTPDRAWLESLFPGVDLILIEGLDVEGAPRILVEAGDRKNKRDFDSVDVLISDDADRLEKFSRSGKPAFPHGDAAGVLDALEELWKGK